MRIGIMGAMPEEIQYIKDNLLSQHSQIIGDREFTSENLCDIETIVAFSRWGKVASAITAQQ
jgi:adenosylhomocysteine nucleosidase